MNAKDIENMKSGRDTDVIILREVYGLELNEGEEPPEYSRDLCAAMELAQFLASTEEWNEHPFDLHKNYVHKDMWTASFDDYYFSASAETPALAICRAALLAVEDK